MTQALTPFDSLLMTVVLVTLAIGLPILIVLAIRFLWDGNLHLGRSKELEKLIWQLHRIASAMEQQMNLSFPAVQPGTEEPSDLAYLQQPAAQAKAVAQATAQSVATPSAAAPAATEPAQQQPAPSEQVAQQSSFPPLVPRDPSAEPPRHAGVNSMFGL
jgi:hypothetical protein